MSFWTVAIIANRVGCCSTVGARFGWFCKTFIAKGKCNGSSKRWNWFKRGPYSGSKSIFTQSQHKLRLNDVSVFFFSLFAWRPGVVCGKTKFMIIGQIHHAMLRSQEWIPKLHPKPHILFSIWIAMPFYGVHHTTTPWYMLPWKGVSSLTFTGYFWIPKLLFTPAIWASGVKV